MSYFGENKPLYGKAPYGSHHISSWDHFLKVKLIQSKFNIIFSLKIDSIKEIKNRFNKIFISPKKGKSLRPNHHPPHHHKLVDWIQTQQKFKSCHHIHCMPYSLRRTATYQNTTFGPPPLLILVQQLIGREDLCPIAGASHWSRACTGLGTCVCSYTAWQCLFCYSQVKLFCLYW